jgi:hypothetical protein
MRRRIGSLEKSVQSWHRRLVFFHHLSTLSTLASTFGGIVTPIYFAAFRLIIILVGCSLTATSQSVIRMLSKDHKPIHR